MVMFASECQSNFRCGTQGIERDGKEKKKKNLVSESLKGVRLMRMLGLENESGVENEMQANLQHLSEISKHDRLGTFAASNKQRSLLLAQAMDRFFFIFPFRFQGVRLSLNIK